MGKQWAKQQIKTNELQEFVEKTLDWVAVNREKVLYAALGLALALSLAGLAYYRRGKTRDDAWERLSIAQAYAFTGKVDDSLKQLSELERDFSSSDASGYAAIFEGDVLYKRGSYKEAIAAYTKALARGGKTIEPLALANIGMCQEASGAFAEARDTDRKFLDTYPDHFMAPAAHASLARSLGALKQTDDQRAALQKMTLQYPETFWANWAQARLQGK